MFRGMEYVYEVNKEKSFSKAAQNLHISQPSLSTSIKRIEKKLGSPIFDRGSSSLKLTSTGEEYMRCILEIMDIERGFENYLNNLDTLKVGRITIGVSYFFASFVLPPIISQFTAKYPFIKLNIVEATTSQLEEMLFMGDLDLVIDNTVLNPSIFDKKLYGFENLILAVPRELLGEEAVKKYALSQEDIIKNRHLENSCKAVPLWMFESVPFILLKYGNDTRLRADLLCKQEEFTPNVILEVEQQVSSFNIMSYGLGAIFISDTLVKRSKPDDNVMYFKLNGNDTKRDISFYYKHGKYFTKAIDEFLRIAYDLDVMSNY